MNQTPSVISTATPWLETLARMAESLGPQHSLLPSLSGLLHNMADGHGFLRAHMVLFDPESGLLRLCLADATPKTDHSEYSPGVGVTGQVFATGEAVMVRRMKDHPLFLSKLFERSEEELDKLAFLCVPILAPPQQDSLAGREVIGTLNADTPYLGDEDLTLRCAFLRAVAALIANQAAYLQEDMARRRALVQGNRPGQATGEFVAHSKLLRHVLERASQVAPSRSIVLLRGEPGVGKERLARRIYEGSLRADMPLTLCPCAALPQESQEAELCGVLKGMFEGAGQTRKGLFELAHMGTLFLDGVECLGMKAQEALLRLLERRECVRLGETRPVPADVRVIAASSATLEHLVEQKRFHAGLFALLAGCTLHIPPLRERREDIIPLAEHFLEHMEKHVVRRISYPALELLTGYIWPGNVPELKSCLQRAAQICSDQVIRAADLPPSLQTAESSSTGAVLSLGDTVARFEKEMLADALVKAGGNMLKAARDLKTSYRIVNYKVKKYSIDPHQFNLPRK